MGLRWLLFTQKTRTVAHSIFAKGAVCLLACQCLFLAACFDAGTAGVDDAGMVAFESRLPKQNASSWRDYVDAHTGFTSKFPENWVRTVLSDSASQGAWMDGGGHAITFQSPPTSEDDPFSDYIMVEMLPSAPAGGFIAETGESERLPVEVDGRRAHRERIVLRDFSVDDAAIDLVAYQVVTEELGYSMGLYVVGELREDARLAEIMTIFMQHFVFPPDRLQVSTL